VNYSEGAHIQEDDMKNVLKTLWTVVVYGFGTYAALAALQVFTNRAVGIGVALLLLAGMLVYAYVARGK